WWLDPRRVDRFATRSPDEYGQPAARRDSIRTTGLPRDHGRRHQFDDPGPQHLDASRHLLDRGGREGRRIQSPERRPDVRALLVRDRDGLLPRPRARRATSPAGEPGGATSSAKPRRGAGTAGWRHLAITRVAASG